MVDFVSISKPMKVTVHCRCPLSSSSRFPFAPLPLFLPNFLMYSCITSPATAKLLITLSPIIQLIQFLHLRLVKSRRSWSGPVVIGNRGKALTGGLFEKINLYLSSYHLKNFEEMYYNLSVMDIYCVIHFKSDP